MAVWPFGLSSEYWLYTHIVLRDNPSSFLHLCCFHLPAGGSPPFLKSSQISVRLPPLISLTSTTRMWRALASRNWNLSGGRLQWRTSNMPLRNNRHLRARWQPWPPTHALLLPTFLQAASSGPHPLAKTFASQAVSFFFLFSNSRFHRLAWGCS